MAAPRVGEDLHQAAHDLLAHAYAPYSGFPVGAVVLTHDANRHVGTNVENAAYGSTICAERVAIGAMVAAGDHSGIQAVVIAGHGAAPLSPCGACRQVIAEFSSPTTVVTSRGDDGSVGEWSIADLLPEAFGPLVLAAGQASADDDPVHARHHDDLHDDDHADGTTAAEPDR